MHRSEYQIDGERVLVHHNGDWSGDVIIVRGGEEVEIPAKLLVEIGRRVAVESVIRKLIVFLEQIDPDTVAEDARRQQ